MTSESGPFAGRAAEGSLLALSRTQRGCAGAAVLLLVWWLLHAPRSPAELVGAVLVGAAAVGAEGRSGVDRVVVALAFWSRSRWTYVALEGDGPRLAVAARGRARCVLGQLDHRGRYDLSGEDQEMARTLAAMVDQLSVGGAPRVATWHAISDRGSLSVVLAVPDHVAVPAPFRPVPRATAVLGDLAVGGWLLERWRYVRGTGFVAAVFALVSTVATDRSALAPLAPLGSGRSLSVVVSVASARSGRALVGRHAHRWRADVALAALAGFRDRATFAASVATLERRERDVATGRALARAAVLVVVRAPTVAELESRVCALREEARAIGVTLARANGQHAPWLCVAIPGAPAWRAP